MARKSRSNKAQQAAPEEFGLDEADEFQMEKEQILFEDAGLNQRKQDDDDESDDDQEVMDIDDDDLSEDEEEIEKFKKQFKGPVDEDDEQYFGDGAQDDEDAEDDGWGTSRNDYYGADDIEEADSKSMEREALKIQKKHLEELNMDDYMLDEMDEEWKKEVRPESTEEESKDSKKIDLTALDTEGQLEVLKSTYPEFLPLTKELKSLTPLLTALTGTKDTNELTQIKHTALSAYVGTIGTYFALFISYLKSGEQFSMKDEPVMSGILSTREIWRQANELPNELPEAEEFETAESASENEIQQIEDNSSEEISEVEKEEEEERLGEVDDANMDFTKKRHIKKLKARGAEYIDDIDAEEKRGRRKTLRFYTSKIDQQENKKDAKFQGDQDLPYKERLFERQQRLVEEAQKRGDRSNTSAPGVDLDDEGFDDLDIQVARSVNDAEDEDYYNKIESKKVGNKMMRQDAHNKAVKAAKEGRLAELQESVGESGKRAVNYQIMKNRGLTPHRNKDNRNSRVKKRKKYAQAQKKLTSIRAVYKTPQGAYSGEATGIKKNLSKSVKLV